MRKASVFFILSSCRAFLLSLTAVMALGGLAATPAQALTSYHFKFTVAPDNGSSWAPGTHSTVVTVTNDGTTTIPAGTSLYVENRMLTWKPGRTLTPQTGVFVGSKMTSVGTCALYTTIPNVGQYYASVGCKGTLNSAFLPGETFDAKFSFGLNAGAALTVGGPNNELNDCGTGWITTPGYTFTGGGFVGCGATPLPCNLIQNGDFASGLSVVGNGSMGSVQNPSTVANWSQAFNSTPQISPTAGCGGNPGFISMWGNQVVGEAIQQTLSAPLQTGHTYRLSGCVRWLNNSLTLPQYVRFKVRASHGPLTSYATSPTVMGILGAPSNTPPIAPPGITSTQWTNVALANWTAPAGPSFDTITINPDNNSAANNGNTVSWGQIDNVCLEDVNALCPSLDRDFTLTATLPAGNSSTYQLTATTTPLPTGASFWWQVEEIDLVTGNVVPNTTVTNPAPWWSNPTTNVFAGYNGTATLGSTSSAGIFQQGHKYRIARGVWAQCNPWTSISHTVFMSTP